MPEISIIVPVYNVEQYLPAALDSLRAQTCPDWEAILVDDGSVKDETPAICDEYAAKYPTIVKAIHQENGGHGEGVNQGIRNATGLYYKVVDSDDWLDTDALKKVLDKLAVLVEHHTAPDLMICNYVYEHVEDGTSHTVRYTTVFPQNRQFSCCVSAAWCCPSTPSMLTTSLSTSPCPMSRACIIWTWTCTAILSAVRTRASTRASWSNGWTSSCGSPST